MQLFPLNYVPQMSFSGTSNGSEQPVVRRDSNFDNGLVRQRKSSNLLAGRDIPKRDGSIKTARHDRGIVGSKYNGVYELGLLGQRANRFSAAGVNKFRHAFEVANGKEFAIRRKRHSADR